jgi:uncharacterized protein (DUF488 family)
MGSYAKAKSPAKGIEATLAKENISYVSLVELGNPFLEFSDWEPRYRRLLEAAGPLLVERLLGLLANAPATPVCLLCSEKRAADCHRTVIADYLTLAQNFRVVPIE